MAGGLIIVIRLSYLPSTSSLLSSVCVWDCEPEWGEPTFGVLSDPGAWTWGRTTRGRKVRTVWLLCLVVSDAGVPCPGPPQRAAGVGEVSLLSF